MNSKIFLKKYIGLLISGIICALALNTVAFAQNNQSSHNSKPPEFTKFQDASQFKLPGDGKPFIPPNMDKSPNPSNTRGTIGSDDRIRMTSRDYPWSTIGRVQGINANRENYHCTGTLIYDNLVLTNAHCVINPETGELSQKIDFLPNFINGRSQDTASAVRVVYGTDFQKGLQEISQDWAILVLDNPLGRKYGYLGWKYFSTEVLTRNQNKLFFVGYSGDFPPENPGMTAGFQNNCSIIGEDSRGLLQHDCDTAGGSSGGAIIATIDNNYYIVALNNMESKNVRTGENIINYGVKIDFLNRLLSQS